MNLKELQKHWHKFGKQDPLWAIITSPDKKGGKWKPDEFFDSGKTHVNGVMAYLNAKGIRIQRKRALDFGCGAGRVTQALADHFDEVCGVDIAPSMVKLARKYNRHGDRCRHYVNDADDLKLFSSNSFDFVHTIIVLQHMLPAYATAYIKEFVRVLAPRRNSHVSDSQRKDVSTCRLRTASPAAGAPGSRWLDANDQAISQAADAAAAARVVRPDSLCRARAEDGNALRRKRQGAVVAARERR
jgi:ubiquinone/menaquinone biosynthesis C-methylase UbiE